MSYKHLTINERNKIEVLLKENYSVNSIAKILEEKLSFKTIYNWFNKHLLENVKNHLIKNRKTKRNKRKI